ncbi:MAG: peptidoglycan recognition family protein [Verrucomicrobiota bacterium]
MNLQHASMPDGSNRLGRVISSLLRKLPWCGLAAVIFVTGCRVPAKPGAQLPRRGDEIVVAGQLFHTGAPVVLWMDPGGYDAYRVERRFAPFEEADWKTSQEKVTALRSPNRYGLRRNDATEPHLEHIRGGGWTLEQLQDVVDQFVYHFDVCGTSRQCFKVLHDVRCLSVHFMIDIDGTIYQTLDLKERAWHATISNTRSIGVEIANMGAYRVGSKDPFEEWYELDDKGLPYITIPERMGDGGVRTPNFVGRPMRPLPVVGTIQGTTLRQYDYTPQQYDSLIKLTATLCRVFPKLKCDYPRDANGQPVPHKLPDEQLANYQGLIGHYHIQSNKTDPGPAFQWEYIVERARKLMK